MQYFHNGGGRHIEQSVREFCKDVIRKDFEKFARSKKFPRGVFEQMGKLGFWGAMIPEEYGGAGMNMQNYVILMESLACYGGGSIALTLIAHHSLAAMHILYAGTQEQKEKYLPGMASGDLIGAWCLTEPNAGSDAFGGMRTIAKGTNTGGWLISGTKHFITDGSIADVYVIVSKIEDGSNDSCGAFIVLKSDGEINSRPETNKMGLHASDTSAVVFENVNVENSAKMTGDGRRSTLQVLNMSRIGISAMACGLLRSALSEAVVYAKQRKTFGKPISEYQGVSFPLADASAELTASWVMVEKAAQAADQGKLMPKMSAETKLITTKVAYEGCLASLFVFGGLGYMMDSRVAQDFTDVLLLRIGEGTDNIQRLTVAKELFKRG